MNQPATRRSIINRTNLANPSITALSSTSSNNNSSTIPIWFDPEFYFNEYDDVRAYYKRLDGPTLLKHYTDHGMREGRFPCKHSQEAFKEIERINLHSSVSIEPASNTTTTEEEFSDEAEDDEEPATSSSAATSITEEATMIVRKDSNFYVSSSSYCSSSESKPSFRLNKIHKPYTGVSPFRLKIPNKLNLENRARMLNFNSSAEPKLSILMVTYNRIDCTMVCLESLFNMRNEIPFEILVWDNASSDETIQVLEQVQGITFIKHNQNLHFLRAVNHLAPLAKAEYTLLLNNDTQVVPGSFLAAIDTFERIPSCAAVGGKVILRESGKLQEAGSVFINCSPHGYGRNENPAAPEFNYERPSPFCSGCSLMIKSSIFKELNYLDTRYIPAYFEETDFCVRALKQGYLIYYQPEFVVYHEEGASASKEYKPSELMQRNFVVFKQQHQEFLKQLPSDMLQARSFRPLNKQKRILWIESEMPDLQRGSGYPRMAALLSWLIQDGWHITYHSIWGNVKTSSELPFGVEYFAKADISLTQLVKDRPNYYGLAIISRTPTVKAYFSLIRNGLLCDSIPIIYDMETLGGLREIEKAKYCLDTSEKKGQQMLEEDMSYCKQMSGVIVVSRSEQAYVSRNCSQKTFSLGHILEVSEGLPSYPFENRFGFIFVGYSNFEGSPNIDSLEWFVNDIFPLILKKLPNAFVSIVGKVLDRLKSEFSRNPRVQFYGSVPNDSLQALMDQHRVFIAPTRFSSGIPHKCHMAASSGLPMVCTEILATQLSWDKNIVSIAPTKAELFAEACVRLHSDSELWHHQQLAAKNAVEQDCSIEQMSNFAQWLLNF